MHSLISLISWNEGTWIVLLILDIQLLCLITVKLQLGLPYRNIWINWSLAWDKICLLIFVVLFKRVCQGVWKLGHWRKRCVVVSLSLPQSHNGFRVSRKQCLRKQCLPGCNLVRSLIPYGLWILKILFAQGRIKLSRFLKDWETSWVSNFQDCSIQI